MEKKIGKNVSSGAEKVERIEQEKATAQANASAPAKEKGHKKVSEHSKPAHGKNKGAGKKKETKQEQAVKREKAAAEKRLEAAKARSEKKEKKLMKRAQLKEAKIEKRARIREKKLERKQLIAQKRAERKEKKLERAAAYQEKRAERRAEKAARRELLKNESKAEKQKRIAREKQERAALRRQKNASRDKAREQKLASRQAQRARRSENKRHKREQKTERKKRAPGIGGWLAAVVSLGVACLALATVVTAGGFRMKDMTVASENGYRATLYEMVSVSDDLDDNLSKLRVSSGANEQRKLLTNILVDSALMESALERIPVDEATGTDISAFVNKTGSYARTLLAKLASGGTLSQTERNTVSYLYSVNDKLYGELNELVMKMETGDLRDFLKGAEGAVSEKFGEMGKTVKAEPEELVDAPFSGEGNVEENKLKALEEITSARAEELVKEYFKDYHVQTVNYTGETITADFTCYNFILTDENGAETYAEVTKNGGKLLFFDSYEACADQNFTLEACDKLAREFLASLGVKDVEAVWLTDGDKVADITYVSFENGVRAYPDMIKVRVCESKGRVIGCDMKGYLLNGGGRTVKAALSEEEARGMLSEGLEAEEGKLAVIVSEGKEVTAYEFYCTYEGERYVVYLNADTGEEVEVFRVRESAYGSYLR